MNPQPKADGLEVVATFQTASGITGYFILAEHSSSPDFKLRSGDKLVTLSSAQALQQEVERLKERVEFWSSEASMRVDEIELLEAQVKDARRKSLEDAALICDARAMKNEAATVDGDEDDATSLRAAAWQLSVVAMQIRALKEGK